MNCKKVLSRLHAYEDGEMPARLMSEMDEHLSACSSCRSRVERIREPGRILDSLSVPPVPDGFAAGVMAEARKKNPRAKENRPFSPVEWQAVQWLLDLSVPMRLIAFALVFLACLLGVFMSKELSLLGNPQGSVAEAENLDGFEWFSPTPPASLGCAYITLASGSAEDAGGR